MLERVDCRPDTFKRERAADDERCVETLPVRQILAESGKANPRPARTSQRTEVGFAHAEVLERT